ncbi:hypothetical protein CDL12_17908 [Handroanthus impetiginosus]|uniref:Uncharacterized protein n=1 Tax=Handroanthus impetiginosus TaxID=429701 RepID=A0A2G9GW41_9LAMI|nr:hypothetical protein CDL12_17908 [Handroanthus impetiginosus]
MGKVKRNSAIVISSSDDDGDFSLTTSFRTSKSAPTRKNPKRAKRASLSSSSSRSFPQSSSSDFDEVHFECMLQFR